MPIVDKLKAGSDASKVHMVDVHVDDQQQTIDVTLNGEKVVLYSNHADYILRACIAVRDAAAAAA
jgi:hypothetical protein